YCLSGYYSSVEKRCIDDINLVTDCNIDGNAAPRSMLYEDGLYRRCNYKVDEITSSVNKNTPFANCSSKYRICGTDGIPHVVLCEFGFIFNSASQTCEEKEGIAECNGLEDSKHKVKYTIFTKPSGAELKRQLLQRLPPFFWELNSVQLN
ncbi:hypothetical protein PFISCL1PPCAC_17460, partial [Pristionchus fissidentatus]